MTAATRPMAAWDGASEVVEQQQQVYHPPPPSPPSHPSHSLPLSLSLQTNPGIFPLQAPRARQLDLLRKTPSLARLSASSRGCAPRNNLQVAERVR